MKPKRIAALILAMLLMFAALLAFSETDAETPEVQTPVNLFAEMEVTDLYGEAFDASVFEGKPAMINIWTTWCGFCLEEMPVLSELSEQYGDRITFLGLLAEGSTPNQEGSVTLAQDEIDGGREFYEAKQIGYPTLIPNYLLHYLMQETKLQAYPTTWFLNRDGLLIYIEEGAHSGDDWKKLIEGVLAYVESQDAGNP